MESGQQRPSILVVDDDEVLLGVLGRVLAHAGYEIFTASSMEEALRQEEARSPQLGLLDLSLPDGNAVELAHALHMRRPALPLILMTAYPNRVLETPEAAGEFVRMLTKPMNLDELRQIVAAALAEKPMARPILSGNAAPAHPTRPLTAPAAALPRPAPSPSAPAPHSPLRAFRSGAVLVLLMIVLVLFLAFVAGVPLPGLASTYEEKTVAPAPALGAELVRGQPHTLLVPEDVRVALGILKGKQERIAAAVIPTSTRPLVLAGSTALDPARLMRIRVRFTPAEVREISKIAELPDSDRAGPTEVRELRSGDKVKKNQVLAIVHSVDVGQKKNDLIDALVQLKLDEEVLKRAEKSSEAVPEVFVLNALQKMESDHNAVARALNTLKIWGIPQEDIDAVYTEAEEIHKRRGKRNQTKEEQWARVELKAPDDGIIVERNVSMHEVVVDNTLNLFQIAKVDRLTVVANAPEDDLPTLLKLPPALKRWNVRPLAGQRPGSGEQEGFEGPIDEISYLIDVNQHNAVVKGHIENPGGRLRGGQFVSCTIQLPVPENVVEIPMSAVVDDGRQCVVFVQSDAARQHFTLRRIEVTHRFDKTAFVRSKLTRKEQEPTTQEKEEGLLPRQSLLAGERVLTTGVLELKRELEDRESKSAE
jgi:cobalt-zinc-cadmium efflux system membrane fusion protein